MNQILEEKLTRLAEDEYMIEAIKLLFNLRIEKEKPIIEPEDDDKVIGQKYRAYEKAREMLNGVIIDINSHLNKETNLKGFNKSI